MQSLQKPLHNLKLGYQFLTFGRVKLMFISGEGFQLRIEAAESGQKFENRIRRRRPGRGILFRQLGFLAAQVFDDVRDSFL